MKGEVIKNLTKHFELHIKKTSDKLEFWLARDLQNLLGYQKWKNFKTSIAKAKIACEGSKNDPKNHFIAINKTINSGVGVQRSVEDMMLTRYACYLIAQNGDPRKEEIAFAQTYFALQTRKFEVMQEKILELERVTARRKPIDTEKEFPKVIYEHTGSTQHFGAIRAKGDKALLGYTTQEMKKRWNVPKNRPLADFSPTIILKAKDFATEITIFNAKAKAMSTRDKIANEHITNNKSVRKLLVQRDIHPEMLEAEKDIKRIKRERKAEHKKRIRQPDKL